MACPPKLGQKSYFCVVMKKKKHLTREQRYTISVLFKQGYSQSFIAKTIGKDRSVISRDIKRNSSDKRGVYNYKTAQRKADFRKQRFHRRRTFTRQKREFIEEHLKKKWSPEQIVGYCKKNNIDMVSHETIFQYIQEDKALGRDVYKHLRYRLKHWKRPTGSEPTIIKDKIIIELRPDIVDEKARLGDR